MFTITIKGKQKTQNQELVKLEMILYKTGYARVTKVLNITGPFVDWDSQSQRFKSKGVDALNNMKIVLQPIFFVF